MNNQVQTIHYPPLEQIPGLTFRHFKGDADYQIDLDLFNQTRDIDGITWVATLDEMKNEHNWRHHFDINKQFIFVEKDGKVIGNFLYSWRRNASGIIIFSIQGKLLAEWRTAEIAGVMLQYAEEKCRKIAARLPKDETKVLQTWRMEIAQDSLNFFLNNGYKPIRYFYEMKRTLDQSIGEFPLPEGIEIRPVEEKHYRQIWDANIEAFKDHWGMPANMTEEHYLAWQKERTFQPDHWKVAWDGEEVAGMVLNFVDRKENEEYHRKRGYTEDICVRRPWRKRGLAKALIAESIRMFGEMGMTETALGVDTENPSGAHNLYSDLGYEPIKEETSVVVRKPIDA